MMTFLSTSHLRPLWPLLAALLFLLSPTESAIAELVCKATDSQGRLYISSTLESLPEGVRASANCQELKSSPSTNAPSSPADDRSSDAATTRGSTPPPPRPSSNKKGAVNHTLAAPGEVEIGNSVRRELLSTPIGQISMRWPRRAEQLFGRNPLRAMTDAAQTVSRTLKQGAFPPAIQTLSMKWEVVFLDEELPEHQIPTSLISNCHPGWMTPPANIYIVAQRVAEGCSGARQSLTQADKALTRILVHELGHAIEFQLAPRSMREERFRREGFATWFEYLAARHSALLSDSEILSYQLATARKIPPGMFSPEGFQGSALEYARASMYFHAITRRKNLGAVMKVYEVLNAENAPFFDAVKKGTGWNRTQIEGEVQSLLK